MPYDVNNDDTQEFAAIVPPRPRLTRRSRFVATGVATLGLAAIIGIAAGGTGSAHPAKTAANPPVTVAAPGPDAGEAAASAPSSSPTVSPSPSAPAAAPTPAATKAATPKPTTPKSTKTPKPKDAKPKGSAKGSGKPAAKTSGWVAPMRHYRMTSCYGPRWGSVHQGIDFAVAKGAAVYAAAAGVVQIAGWNSGGYGNMVVIKHSGHVFTLYGHASKLLVHAGQKVKAGQEIMLEGGTGHVTGPHLHFEVWSAMWHRMNPATFLRKHGVALPRC